MQLYTRKFDASQAENPDSIENILPLIILHGLFGSGDNWGFMARRLARLRPVVCVDITNHGRSPHSAHISYQSMADDVWETLDAADIGRCILLGHSMGGKLAMVAALGRRQQVAGLIVADIAPKNYPAIHIALMEVMQEVENAAVTTRQAAESILRRQVTDPDKRAFLLKSLVSHGEGDDQRYVWRFNLAAIRGRL